MAGRRPKPTILKLVAGNPGKRAVNKKEPKPKRVIPSCPAHLKTEAKVAWGRLCVLLDGMGVLTEADVFTLERLCGCYAELIRYDKLIDTDGPTYTTSTNTGDTLIKANPAVAMFADADRRFKSYLIEFGLTPAARSKVHGAPPDPNKKDDPLAEFFG